MAEVSSGETVDPALVVEIAVVAVKVASIGIVSEAVRVAGNPEEAELVNEIVAASTTTTTGNLADELAGTAVDVELILLAVDVETVVETAVVVDTVD